MANDNNPFAWNEAISKMQEIPATKPSISIADFINMMVSTSKSAPVQYIKAIILSCNTCSNWYKEEVADIIDNSGYSIETTVKHTKNFDYAKNVEIKILDAGRERYIKLICIGDNIKVQIKTPGRRLTNIGYFRVNP